MDAREQDRGEDGSGFAGFVDGLHPRVVESGAGPAVDGEREGNGGKVWRTRQGEEMGQQVDPAGEKEMDEGRDEQTLTKVRLMISLPAFPIS